MSLAQTVALGALAGFSIFLGLPLGRLQTLSPRARVALAMFSVGILAFIFVDVFEHAFEIVEEPVQDLRDGNGGLGEAVGYTAMIAVGFVLGSAGLAQIERRLRPKGPRTPPIAGGSSAAVARPADGALENEAVAAQTRALNTGLAIAAAI